MKINIIRDENNVTMGWDIQAENEDDRLTLGTIRNFEFWGMGDRKIEYDGMRTWTEDSDYVDMVKYRTVGYKKEQRKLELEKQELMLKSLRGLKP